MQRIVSCQTNLIQTITFVWNSIRLYSYLSAPVLASSSLRDQNISKRLIFSILNRKIDIRFTSQVAHDLSLGGGHEQNALCQKLGIYFEPTIHQGTGIDSTQELCSRKPSSWTDAKLKRLIQVLRIECSTPLSAPRVARKPAKLTTQFLSLLYPPTPHPTKMMWGTGWRRGRTEVSSACNLRCRSIEAVAGFWV